MGTGITVLGVIRALSRAKVPVYCLCENLENVAYSRYYRRLSYDIPLLTSSDNLERYLERLPLERAVLMPCSDNWVQAVGQLSPALRERFPSVQAELDPLERLIDKGRFAEELVRLGIPHPYTKPISSAEDFSAIDESRFGDSFLKPRNSQEFFKRYRVKAFAAATREGAVRRWEEIKRAGFEVILQEYVPGPPTNHYFIDGYVTRDGEFHAFFARQRIRMFPRDFGNSSYMTSVPTHVVEPAIISLKELLSSLEYRGIFSAEFKRDEHDGLFKILEVNTRPWWFVEFASVCGVNVCEMAYRDALGLQPAPVNRYRVGVSCVNLYYDLHACGVLHRAGRLGYGEALFSWLRARNAVFCWDDPLPSLAWFAGLVARRIGRFMGARPAVMVKQEL